MSNRKQIGGTQFSWERKNGKINVYIEKTAQGQNTIAGTYDVKTKSWQNSRKKIVVPNDIRHKIEIMCEKEAKRATA